MNKLILSLVSLFSLSFISPSIAQEKEKQLVIENRKNDSKQEEKPYVILISIDGFRYDYIEKYNAEFLKKLGEQGVRAESMLPSYPSVTFPNHYSIVTGMYPAHHGLVGNRIYDPKMDARYSLGNAKAVKNKEWYGGTPLWVLAEQQGMLSACYYWPGSEADIKQTLPSYYYAYSEKSSMDDRIGEVVNWLSLPSEERPHFITFYLPEVDHAGHKYGPDAKETEEAVKFADESIKKLVAEVSKTNLPVNFVVVSDHGMLALNQKKLLSFPLKLKGDELKLVSNGTYMSVFVNDKSKIDEWYNKIKKAAKTKYMKVYKNADLPEEYNFGGEHDRFGRVGDIVITAEPPYYFTNRKLAGSHGFDPKTVKEMHAIFLASGPQFKNGVKVESFENVNVYPIITNILGLQIQDEIDGTSKVADEILKK
ncbi:alkaline phosphatase family protein [Myroides injenensis]|uniref:alkaline phosphatase family protein n=1 Tax=Myroides injenensis TaxID=1183151 RepID=UPI00226D7460|nr:ectonucleotide pyrophosphatase/phosphodiesterase [Myroides injenensis]